MVECSSYFPSRYAANSIKRRLAGLLAAMGMLLIGACGGGGSSTQVAPGSGPVVNEGPAVTVFAHPSPQKYVSIGASTTDLVQGYTPASQDTRLLNVFFDAASQPLLKYDASGHYEIKFPGLEYDRLVHYEGLEDPTEENDNFQLAGFAQNNSAIHISKSRLQGYNDSEMASWSTGDNLTGFFAFGVSTPADALPSTGSATFGGTLMGVLDIAYVDNLVGGYFFNAAVGTVTLNVDFANDSVTGSLMIREDDGLWGRDIGTFPILSATGLTGFSSSIGSGQTGYNQFAGLFTGSSAQEAIGNWALSVMIDGQPHQLIGAWIAKRM